MTRPLLDNIFNGELLYDQYQTAICEIVNDYFNPDYLNLRIDAIKDLAQNSVYADNNKMYSNTDFDENIEVNISGGGGPIGGTIFGLKSFVQQKHNYITGILDCSNVSNAADLNSQTMSLYPNPVHVNAVVVWEEENVHLLKIFNYLGVEVYRKPQMVVKFLRWIFLPLKLGLISFGYFQKTILKKTLMQ